MIKKVLYIIVIISIGFQASAQSVESDIRIIRKEFKRINMLKVKPKSYTFEKWNCGHLYEFKFWVEKGTVVKIVGKGQTDHTEWVEEYYFNNGQLIFFYEHATTALLDNTQTKNEEREYYKNGKFIRYIHNKDIVNKPTHQFKTIKRAKRILAAYSTKRFKPVVCN